MEIQKIRRKLNILFILYHNFASNSAIHVHGFANAFAEKGHECLVAVPDDKESATKIFGDNIKYTPVEFDEINVNNNLFTNNQGPDIIHSWTPRENVRKLALQLKNRFPDSKLIVHLEDNEESILEKHTRLPIKILKLIPNFILDSVMPESVSHPVRYKEFLNTADGITVIMDTLLEFAPKNKKNSILWPIIDTETFFFPREKDDKLKQQYGIKETELIIVYTGNVHLSNAKEVRELYMAVGLANIKGISVKLIRTGIDLCQFIKKNDNWVREYCIELGYIPRETIPAHLSLADVLIQPGESDEFNDFRLPSKIPEFLAMGKPVAIPSTNIGRFLKNNEEALIMKKGNREEIVSIIKKIHNDKNTVDKIARKGRSFAVKNFSKRVITQKLEEFYKTIINS